MKKLVSTGFVAVVFCITFFNSHRAEAQLDPGDSLALVTLYDSTSGPSWANSSNWFLGAADTWFGVTVTGGRVSRLELPGNNLSGKIPADIGNLTAMTFLNLNSNFGLQSIPPEIGTLSALDTLDLGSCFLGGTIPTEIGGLTNLVLLDLNNNSLADSIPSSITNLNFLQDFRVQQNSIENTADLSLLSSLSALDISNNKFEFDDILPLVGIPGIIYSPQQNFGVALDTGVFIGANITLDGTAPGAGNVYQWQQDLTDIGGATGSTYTIIGFSLADSGAYRVNVTNPAAPSLTLSSFSAALFPEDSTYFLPIAAGDIEGSGGGFGGAWGDFDGDGDLDLFVNSDDHLFFNNGDGTFSKATGDPIVTDGNGFGGTVGDYDNDGDLDIYTASNGASGSKLFSNDGTGAFTRIMSGEISLPIGDFQDYVWGDYDNDGFLDLFITAGANINGEENFLFRNNQDGTFSQINDSPIATDFEPSVSASWSDYDEDGDLDLYVLNQNPPFTNGLYQNNGDGSFTRIFNSELVVDNFGSFGASWGDYDNDADLDFFVTNQGADPVIFVNEGGGDFSRDTTLSIGSSLTLTGNWGDIDNDGDLDLYVTTFDFNRLYLNDGTGNFSEVQTGSIVAKNNSAFGSTFADYDVDGDLDLVVSELGSGTTFFKNTTSGINWINISLEGTISNNAAIGAKIYTSANIGGQDIWQIREVSGGTGLFSQNSLIAHFGLGDASVVDTLRVVWPSGISQTLTNVSVNQQISVQEQYTPVNASDSLALVALYNALDGNNWANNENWLTGNVLDWYGVRAPEGSVTEIDLRNNNLVGSLPPEIGDFTSLTYLNLGDEFTCCNAISGEIPPEIGNLTNLRYLGIANNELYGAIPDEIGNLLQLEEIDLTFNNLDTLPSTIGNLVNLTYLGIAFNLFESLPADIYTLPSLEVLLISGNQLSGPIPTQLGDLTTLTFLNIGENDFSGPIPDELGTLTNLYGIRIWNMPQVTGMIPSTFNNLINLNELTVQHTSVDSIPDLSALAGLNEIFLNDNALKTVPDFTAFSSPTTVDISENRLPYAEILKNIGAQSLNAVGQKFRYDLTIGGSFTLGATGTLTLNSDDSSNTFQWYKEGFPIPGETSGTLTIANITEQDIGLYTCLVNNLSFNADIPSESFVFDIDETDRRYATGVTGFSSSDEPINYAPEEALGLPNAGFFDGEFFENRSHDQLGWSPLDDDVETEQFISLSFDNPAPINTIWLFGNSSFRIDSIFARNPGTGQFELVTGPGLTGQVFGQEKQIDFPVTPYLVSEIRISYFDPFRSLDAVAIGLNALEIPQPELTGSNIIADTIVDVFISQSIAVDSLELVVERSLSRNSGYAEVSRTESNLTRYSDRNAPAADSVFYRARNEGTSGNSDYSEVLKIEKCESDIPTQRTWTGTSTPNSFNGNMTGFDPGITITRTGLITYEISDVTGGWMNFDPAFQGEDYELRGILTDNCGVFDLEVLDEPGLNCGDPAVTVTGVEYFPGQDSLKFSFDWVDCGVSFESYFKLNTVDPIQPPPFELQLGIINNTGILLRWQDATNYEDVYVIERSDGDSLSFMEIATAPKLEKPFPTITDPIRGEYHDTGLTTGVTYYYRMRTRNGSGDSDPSEVVFITLEDPIFNRIVSGPVVSDQPTHSYSGYWGDYDNDGDPDLYVQNWQKNNDPFFGPGTNYFYENNGDGSFTKITTGDFVQADFPSRSGSWGDLDNDGNMDLVVVPTGEEINKTELPIRFYINQGDKSFNLEKVPRDVSETHAILADFDRDGFLDALVGYELFVNDRNGNLVKRSEEFNFPVFNNGFAPSVFTPDYNNDNWPDIFVTGDNGCVLYKNHGNFFFEEVPEITEEQIQARASAWADFDVDGDLDVVLSGRFGQNPVLFINNGDETFERRDDVDFLGESIFLQRGLTVIDFDNDGLEDMLGVDPGQGALPVLFQNNGDNTFTRVTGNSVGFIPTNDFTPHFAIADYNLDGTQDIFYTALNFGAHWSNSLYANNNATGNWLRVQLEGSNSNRSALGAVVRVKANGNWSMRQVNTYNGTWSGNEVIAHFGLAAAASVDSVEILWPSGQKQFLGTQAIDQVLQVTEPFDSIPPIIHFYEDGSSDPSPELFGASSKPLHSIFVTVNGQTLEADIFNEDTAWSVPPGELNPLPLGIYDVQVLARDFLANETDTTFIDALRIADETFVSLSSEVLADGDIKQAEPGGHIYTLVVDVDSADAIFEGVYFLFDSVSIDMNNFNDAGFRLYTNTSNDFETAQFQMIGDKGIMNPSDSFPVPAHGFGFLTDTLLPVSSTTYYFVTVDLSPTAQIGDQFQVLLPDFDNQFGIASPDSILDVGLGAGPLITIIEPTPPLVADSLALVTLFDSLGGEFWERSKNWLFGAVDSWEGISVSNERVTRIDLSSNNLTGKFPFIESGLEELTDMDLSDNELKDVSDISNFAAMDTVDVSANRLLFTTIDQLDDGAYDLIVQPQKEILEPIRVLLQIGESFVVDRTVPGGTGYSWTRDGNAILQTSPSFEVTVNAIGDEAVYRAEVTSTLVPGLTLITSPVDIRVSSLERDEKSLRAVYEALGGASSTLSDWPNDPISAWPEVEVPEGRVTEVRIRNKGLVGKMPDDILDIESLIILDIADNEITRLPPLTDLENITTVLAGGNNLDFSSIIPNFNFDSVDFSDQGLIGKSFRDTIPKGQDYAIRFVTGGSQLRYQWAYKGNLLFNATKNPHVINDINFDNMGDYSVQVTSDLAQGIVLTSRTQTILAYGNIEFFPTFEFKDGSEGLVSEGESRLYRIRSGPFPLVRTVNIENEALFFEKIVLGDYILDVRTEPDFVISKTLEGGEVDEVQFIPTYFESEIDWLEADTLRLRDFISDALAMQRVPPPLDDPANEGEIAMLVEADLPDEEPSGRVDARRRVKKAGCSLRRRRTTGGGRPAQDDEFELIAYKETDDNGEVSFGFLPDGSYRLNIQFPGVPMDPNSFIEFVIAADEGIAGYELAATVTEEGIIVERILGFKSNYFKELVVYPNPTRDYVSIAYRRLLHDGVQVRLMDMSGRVLINKALEKGIRKKFELDVEGLNAGVYLLHFYKQEDKDLARFRIIIKD